MLAKHEQFEMDVLYHLNSGRILEKIVFGGGTMLRLCHELNRYSADLDFWLIKTVAIQTFQNKITDRGSLTPHRDLDRIDEIRIGIQVGSADAPQIHRRQILRDGGKSL